VLDLSQTRAARSTLDSSCLRPSSSQPTDAPDARRCTGLLDPH
jgi:hypothetical protein